MSAVFQFINQSSNLQDTTTEDFTSKYKAFVAATDSKSSKTSSAPDVDNSASEAPSSSSSNAPSSNPSSTPSDNIFGTHAAIVLRCASQSSFPTEPLSFTLTSSPRKKLWTFGRDPNNDICMPHDLSLLGNKSKYIRYAAIRWAHGHFYLEPPAIRDTSSSPLLLSSSAASSSSSSSETSPKSAKSTPTPEASSSSSSSSSVGTGPHRKPLQSMSSSSTVLHEEVVSYKLGNKGQKEIAIEEDASFCIGSSVITCSITHQVEGEGPGLHLRFLSGPRVGQEIHISSSLPGGCLKPTILGRYEFSDSSYITFEDKEISRRHCQISYNEVSQKFMLSDCGSTNGTYILLTGPSHGNYKLDIDDGIRIGKTCYKISRFDFGSSEEIGIRPTMEDAMSNLQDLRIDSLQNCPSVSPQSFFGVFDGHVGGLASVYLEEHLHENIKRDISSKSAQIVESVISRTTSSAELASDADWLPIDEIIKKTLVATYLDTDKAFIASSKKPQHGSTATTALLLGKRLYVANVGDSRVFLCRNRKSYIMTDDHKPNRPDELARIQAAGGFVINKRVMGELSVSRTFGDCDFKTGMQGIISGDVDNGDDADRQVRVRDDVVVDKDTWESPLIVAEPEFMVTSITDNDQFLLLACDGLFDVFKYDEITTFILDQMSAHQNPKICCENLTHEAIKVRKSKDNVSVLLIILNKWY